MDRNRARASARGSRAGSAPAPCAVGVVLKNWRQRRRLSQLELASQANVSTRHLSFIETGRARPSERMVHHLAAHLEMPPHDRDHLLLVAGFLPEYLRPSMPTRS
jgi:transcriptional regulator with XRE-family HTH domain